MRLSGLDQLIHGKKVEEYLRNVKGMTPAEIASQIGYTNINGRTRVIIHRQTDKTEDVLYVSINGDIEEA